MGQDDRRGAAPGRRASRREALGLIGAAAVVAPLAAPFAASAAEPAFPPGAVIRTLLKDYAPSELAGGATLFHEHMSTRDGFMVDWMRHAAETREANRAPGTPARPVGPPPGAAGAAPEANFTADEGLMVSEMEIARREGIGCIVDAGHPDMGRDVGFLRRISQRSGLPIVASAGFYTQPFYPADIGAWSEERVVEEIMKQVRANPTGALGEIGSWDYITKDERKVFRAVGKVHRLTNIPIFTHTGIPGKSALEQLDILEDAGVDPKHVVIGHLGNLADPSTEIQRAIIRRGAFIGFDRQGGAGDAPVVSMAASLIAQGYADHLMFASDFSSPRDLKKNGGAGYAKTLTVFAPKLKAAGVSDADLHKIMYDNPRRFLAFIPKIKRT